MGIEMKATCRLWMPGCAEYDFQSSLFEINDKQNSIKNITCIFLKVNTDQSWNLTRAEFEFFEFSNIDIHKELTYIIFL